MHQHAGLAVLVGGEILRLGDRDRRVAIDHLLHDAAHGLDAERQRDDVQQQRIAATRQRLGLERRADRDHFVGIDVGKRRATEECLDLAADQRHARGAAHQHHALDILGTDLRIVQHLAAGAHGALDQRLDHLLERAPCDGLLDLAAGDLCLQRRALRPGQGFLGCSRRQQQRSGTGLIEPGDLAVRDRPFRQCMVEIIAAERGIAAGRQHLEHALLQAQQRDVEGAAAQIVDRIDSFGAGIEAVGQRGCGRFVHQAQHVEAGQLRRILGGAARGIVEIGRHRHDGLGHFQAQRLLGARLHGLQDLGRHFDRRHRAAGDFQPHHADGIAAGRDLVRQHARQRLHVMHAAAHQPLDRAHHAIGILRAQGLCVTANDHTIGHQRNDRRDKPIAVGIA